MLYEHDPLFPTKRGASAGATAVPQGRVLHDRLRRTLAVPLPIVFRRQGGRRRLRAPVVQLPPPAVGNGADGVTRTTAGGRGHHAVRRRHHQPAALIAYERFDFVDGVLPRAARRRPGPLLRRLAQLAVLMGVPAWGPASSDEVAGTTGRVEKFHLRPVRRAQLGRSWRCCARRNGRPPRVITGHGAVGSAAVDIRRTAQHVTASARLAVFTDPCSTASPGTLPLFEMLRIGPVLRAAVSGSWVPPTPRLAQARGTGRRPKPREHNRTHHHRRATADRSADADAAQARFDDGAVRSGVLRGSWVGREVYTGIPRRALANVAWYGKQFDGPTGAPAAGRDAGGNP